jgi:hypothetical protein
MAKTPQSRLPILAGLIAVVLLAAACGSSDNSSESSESPEPTEEPASETTGATGTEEEATPDATPEATPTGSEPGETELTASWQGVTEDTVRVGVTVIDTDELAELFDVHLDLAPTDLLEGLAATLNSNGGVGGRQLEIFVETFLPVGTGPAEEICTKFVEDNEVFMVTGQALDDTMLCYTETYEVPYLGYFGLTPEREERSIAPFISVEMASDLQRRNATEILVDGSYLDDKAVAVYWSEADELLARDAVIPTLEDGGIDVVATAALPSFGGDQLATDEAIDIIVESFRADGVEAIVNISEVVTLSQGIDRVDYRPDLFYLNGQVSNAEIFEGSGIDPETLTGAMGVAPSNLSLDELKEDKLWIECIESYNASGPEEPFDLDTIEEGIAGSVAQNCGGFWLLTMLLEAAGPDLTPSTIAAAADNMGTFDLPGLPGASLGPGKWSAGNAMRIYQYSPDLFRFEVDGDPIVIEG